MDALSCLIGHLFTTLEPPCNAGIAGEITLAGTTRSGKHGTLAITGGAFVFEGDPEDMAAASLAAAECGVACTVKERGGRGC